MNGLLLLLGLALCVGIAVFLPGFGAAAVVVCAVPALVAGLLVSRVDQDKAFLLRLFVMALYVRMLVGTLIFAFRLQGFFGGDAFQYDLFGFALLKSWGGDHYYTALVNYFMGVDSGGGWGMLYLVALVYGMIGRNMLAIQFLNAVMGAATAPVIYLCARHVFGNMRVARVASLFVAFYPSLVLWSAQGLKDGPIVFLLATSMLAALELGSRFNTRYFILLVCSLFALLSLRFYVFYMMVAAIGGAFIIGMRAITAQSFLRQFVVIVGIGLSLTYLGVLRYASVQYETYGNLEAVQRSRLDQTQGQSGFSQDADVSTTSGALSAVPMGLLYLLFAPFPWQLASLRQSITLPEMLIWWASFPLLVLGIWFTVKFRLRQASPILIFTPMLTLAYSLFQGNIGTAYRQRAQLLIFYFMFVAVGYVLLQEKREDKKRQEAAAREESKERMPRVRA
ncbi:MAG: glycosyltransferase family 39 protein [Pyrinomonadaceae bacterium]